VKGIRGFEGPGNEPPLLNKAVIALLKRRMEKEAAKMNVGDKPALKSSSVWGTLMIAVGGLIVAVGHVLTGDQTWGHVAQVAQQVDIVGVILGVVGIVVQGVGQRRAIGNSGPKE
jgi:hypothetical protein